LVAIRREDFRSGGKPDLAVRRNMGERAIERADAVRRPDQEAWWVTKVKSAPL
jgi:hypothetical protein